MNKYVNGKIKTYILWKNDDLINNSKLRLKLVDQCFLYITL